jgi:hypothetical protein
MSAEFARMLAPGPAQHAQQEQAAQQARQGSGSALDALSAAAAAVAAADEDFKARPGLVNLNTIQSLLVNEAKALSPPSSVALDPRDVEMVG